MANPMSATLIGFEELAAGLKSSKSVLQDELVKALNQTAIQVRNRALEKVPKKTGSLQSSIHTEPAVATSNNVIAKVGTDKVYARAQEYGTEGMQINGKSKLGKSFTYVGNIKPKFYMRDAKNDSLPDFTQNIANAMQRVIKRAIG